MPGCDRIQLHALDTAIEATFDQITKIGGCCLLFIYWGQDPFHVLLVSKGVGWQREDTISVVVAILVNEVRHVQNVALTVVSTQIVVA